MKRSWLFLLTLFTIYACQTDDIPEGEEVQNPEIPEEPSDPDEEKPGQPWVEGFYLLNEGNMSMNKASLDYMNFKTGEYRSNIFSSSNPDVVGGLGDVGNDMGIYGSKLYVVLNASNKVEVLDAQTGTRLKQIDINNCRYITFYKGKAYLSSYLGSIGDPSAPNGIVAEIDTTTMEITRRVEVGRQPEELVAHNDKIYVANSGGYSPPDYETTISVIDINSFSETKRIEVAANLNRLKIDSQGDLYVTSRGDYLEIPSKLYVVDTKIEEVKKVFDLGVSNLVIHNDIAYMYNTEFSYLTGDYSVSYTMLDTKSETLLDGSFIAESQKDLIKMPYGIAIHPETEEVLITDAMDYVTPGNLYCFSPEGELKWMVQTGDIPAHIVFRYSSSHE
ncbi:hypothetical protein GCM10007103_19280 [Salinimicrobium marinum]|uniref:YncE family protein n=1 Tax=Salinimicrobium marinum TaxID=680283 RepID=A0A918VYL8_9FLAO|nr:DUF5074 domain-containing protein [Salinimicrobium marinum]GHA37863.1 hypothetical protein GCM10007103_19280 [Salinimicrobium marinum]